jgi:hypothetical protein
MAATEINEGVRLLALRMESNPQEFDNNSSTKWNSVLDNYAEKYWGVLTQVEIDLISHALREAKRAAFTANVLCSLAGNKEQQEPKRRFVTSTSNGTARKVGAMVSSNVSLDESAITARIVVP